MELLRNAGPPGYLALFLGFGGVVMVMLAFVFVAVAKAKQALLFAGLAMAFGSSALLVGAAGRTWGRMEVFRAVAMAAPEYREQLIAQGFEEANAALTLGAGAGLPLLVLGAAVMALTFSRAGGPR